MSRRRRRAPSRSKSAFVALLSLTKSVRPRRPTSSMRCGRPGKVARPARIAWPETPSASATATAAARVLGVVAAAQRARCRRGRRRPPGRRPSTRDKAAPSANTTSAIEPLGRDADDRLAALGARSARDGAANSRRRSPMTARSARGDEALLDGRVVLDRAVPVEMVGRDVEQHADVGFKRWRQVDLKRRHLDDMDAVARGRLERQDRRADVAADLHVAAGLAQDVGDRAPSSSTCRWCR